MNVRSNLTLNRTAVETKRSLPRLKIAILLAIAAVLIYSLVAVFGARQASADAPKPQIRSAIADNCLDVYKAALKPGSMVIMDQCSGQPSQAWSVNGQRIELADKYCLDLTKGKAVLQKCSSSKSQQWVRDGVGLMNVANNNCLAAPDGHSGVQLVISSCDQLDSVNESWTPDHWPGKPLDQQSAAVCDQSRLGDRVACFAQRQWLAWQTEPKLHQVLLNDYTDGNSYEEWCADFVSYVYKQAGAPFTAGERNGWDEYDANNIRYMGFSYHAADSGYSPKPGDVAYFNYSGGHVEIVVSGGEHPTFIYGDSGTKDPITQNGDMAENQITSDGANGQLMYYLSPN